MALLVPTASEDTLLQFMVGDLTPTDQTLKLYVNDYTPVDGSIAASFTEMTTQGYVVKTLTKTSWVVAQAAGVAEAAYAAQTFVFDGTGGDTIVYGYYVIDSGSGLLLWAERFEEPPTVVNNLDEIEVIPVITLSKDA